MKINEISWVGIEHVPSAAYGAAHGIVPARQATVVTVTTESGIVGTGDARGPLPLIAGALETIHAAFLGTNLLDRQHVWTQLSNRMYHSLNDRICRAAYSGLSMAMLDCQGQELGLPIHQLLGGDSGRPVVPYATCGYFSDDPRMTLERQLEDVRRQGFQGAKIKIGHNPESDEQRVRAARDILGDDIALMVDANSNYSPDIALLSMNRIADYTIDWYEEPLPPADLEGYRWLHDRAPMPIAAGEAHSGLREFYHLMSTGGVDILQPNMCSVGGLEEAHSIADMSQLFNKRVIAAVWDSGIGLAAACHYTKTLKPYPHSVNPPTPAWVEMDVSGSPLRDEILVEPLAVRDGILVLPGGPGLGVRIDWARLEQFAVTPHTRH